jgi:filamentous hemagglutinin
MNKKIFRVIWSAARSMRVVVSEAAISSGRGASKASNGGGATSTSAAPTPMVAIAAIAALFGLLVAVPGQAQIVANPLAPGSMRPTILVAPNGVGVVNITTPSAAGVSRNQYIQFDVAGQGAIVNNSRTAVQSQLGGFIPSNPYLATGPARIIVNEVSSSNPSYINGPVEIAGQRADFVLANPSGISVSGGTFINSSQVTLTTGVPQYNAFGGLDSYVVRSGSVTVGGTGLDATRADLLTLISRGVVVNGGIWANDLKVVAGANVVSADATAATPTTGTGTAPSYAIDVAQLGGMYSGHINLIATEAGIGVRNTGSIQASSSAGAAGLAGMGQLTVTAAGRLENTGTLQSTSDANLSATRIANSGTVTSGGTLQAVATQGDLSNNLNGAGGTLQGQSVVLGASGDLHNEAATIRQSSSAGLTLAAATVSNTQGGWIGAEPAAAPTAGTTTGTGNTSGSSTGSTSSGSTTSTTSGTTTTTSAPAPIAPGSITAAGTLWNDNGKVYAGGPITLQTANLVNNGGTLSVAGMALSQPSFSNQGGTLNVSGAFTAHLGTFNNSTGTLHAGSLDISTTGDFDNQDGVLTSDANANLAVGGAVNNLRGSISATGALAASVVGAIQNTSGTLASNQNLSVSAQSLDNSQGQVQSANGNVRATIGQQLLNTDGHISSGANLAIQTGSLDGTKGSLQSTGDLNVTAAQGLTSTGTHVAGGNLALQGASVDLSGSQTSAANIAIAAAQGNVATSGATVATAGTLAITANAQPGQTLVNSAGQLNAGQLQIDASNIANINGGQIVQTGTGATVLAVSGNIDNSNSHIASNGQDLTLRAASITNTSGKIDHAGTGTLTIAGGSYSGANGTMTGNGALKVAMSGDFNQDGGTTTAQQITVDTGLLSNRGGQIIQTGAGAERITAAGAIDSSAGLIASNGQDLTLQAAGIANTGGKIEHAGTGTLNIAGGSYSGANGTITGNGALAVNMTGAFVQDGGTTTAQQITVDTGSLSNRGGQIIQTGSGVTRITAAGALDTSAGLIASNGQDLTLQAASIANTGGKIQHAGAGTLTLAGGSYSGANGTITGNGALAVNMTGAFVQDGGTTTAQQITADTGSLSNRGGQITQTGTGATRITAAGALDNSSGLIATNGQDLTLQAASIVNTAGKIEHAGTGMLNIAGGSYSGANGEITGNGALAVNVSGAFNQDGGKSSAQQITLAAGSLSNQGGSIVQAGTGATTLTVGGALNDNAGVIASNGTLTATAGSMSNQGGTLQAAGTSDLNLTVTHQLDNSTAGRILAGGNATVAAASLNDNAGSITAVGNLNATVSGTATNQGGTLAANGNTTLSAVSLDNSGGTVAAVNGDLTVTTSAATTNNAGTLQAGGTTTLSNGGLSNRGGKVFGNALWVDSHGNTVDNSAQGTLAATTSVDLKSGALNNDAGLVQSGAAMTIDTNGQTLTNTNSAGYTNGQGGITGAGTLTLNAGAVNNNAGFIGAKGDLNASTGALTNANGGTVLGQANVVINTSGASYDNRGGQTLAAGDLTINAGGGTIDNTSSLLRSSGTTTLNADTVTNATTSGANQGIEGTHVAINTGTLGNQTGAVRAARNLTVTSGGTVDNSAGGLLSPGDTLKVIDPNAANPSAKTLNLINTGGTLVADNSVQIDAATFSGDGQLVSGKDLSVALTQDIVNNADVIANGNLSYGTTGHLTNNAKLIAGNTLTVNGNVVDNTANAEMSGANTTLNVGTLNNRGLIDSAGTTRINAGAVNNVGTGRIYGNQIAIATGSLTNDTETVNGTTQAGTIASRGNLDIGATTLTNREHALIFSGADMAIGGSLDASGKAIGQGGTLDNLSATIESLGNMSISMGQTNNWDTHVQLGPQATTTKQVVAVAPVGGSGFYTLDQVIVVPGQPFVWARNPDGSQGALLYSNGYGVWNTTYTTTADTAINADPANILSGGDMTIPGAVYNRDSRIIAGGTLTAPNVNNQVLQGSYSTSSVSVVTSDTGQIQPLVIGPSSSGLMDVGAYQKVDHVNATSSYNAGTAATGSASANGRGASGANGGSRTGTIVEVAANVGGVAGTGGTGAASANGTSASGANGASASGANGTMAGAAGGASGASGQAIPMVVRTSTPSLTVPQASLFSTHPDPSSHFLIETDPRFANYRNWLSSDYLLNSLGLDPNHMLKRLGDGFYEQKLIREQVAQLTGYRYLDGFSNDDDQYAALMNAGATFAKQYGLRPGVALSAAQMAQLTSDIVWLVEQTLTLPDGTTQRVLVPQVYVRVRPGDIDGSGAILSADATVIKSSGDLVNTGTIAGRTMVSINAENVNNLAGGRIAGGSVGLNARNDINNIGASITADNAAILTAGRDINVKTTTASGAAGNSNIDRVAGVYVSNPGGVLIASAGRDVNLIGAALTSGGGVSIGAARNINLSTVTESATASALGQGIAGLASSSREVGSVIQGNGNVQLAAGNDLNIRASAVQSTAGALVATARNDINVTAGQATSNVATATVHSSSTLFTRKSSSTFDSSATTDVLSSSLSGKSVALVAGNDINLQAAQLRSDEAMSQSAGRDIKLTTANKTDQELHASQTRSSATGLANAIGMSMGPDQPTGAAMMGSKSGTHASASITTEAVGTSISAGSLQTVSGRDTTLQGATVVADNDITMLAGRNLTIESAQNTRISSSYDGNSKSGMVGTWYNPAVGNIKGSQANATATTTQQASQVASLAGNVTLVAGNDYRQTASSVMASGQAGPLVGGDVNILAKNVVINAADNTSLSVTLDKSSSSIMGGSANFAGVSTNNIQGAVNTVKAVGDTGGDGRMQALGAINLAMSGKAAYDAVQSIGSGNMTYGVSVNVSRNTSQSTSFTTSTQAVGSGVVGANNVNIVATGGGKDSNIHAVGSTIAAGNTVNMAADNNVTLEASANTSVTAGQNTSHGSNVGVTFGGGAQNGFSIQLGVSNGRGSNNQDDVSFNATQVSGGKAVNISSGGDLTLKGATVQADRVTADVGGNLAIESLQDVSMGQSRQSSSGFNVSLCIPPICYGIVATASASAAGAKADGLFVSPAVQSGIKAGDGGFGVKVAGNTDLKGAVIESTQAAIDAGKNSFSTGGALTMSDLKNVSQSSGDSYSVSGGVSLGYTTAPNAATGQGMSASWTAPKGAAGSAPTGSAGVGSYSGDNQSSVAKSGISGIAGDQSVRTGDASSAGTLVKDWNTQTIVKNVQAQAQAQAQLTQQFNQGAAREIGTYADKKVADLRDQAGKESDPTQKQALLDEAAKWDEGGSYRVAAHMAAGALGGGVAGAIGAGSSAALMPRIGDAIDAMGLPAPVAQAVGAATAAAIGGIVGGGAGAASAYSVDINNRQLHPSERQLIGNLAGDKAKALCQGDAQCEKTATVYWTDILEHAAEGLTDDRANAANLKYVGALLATANDPNSGGARGGAEKYLSDWNTALGILAPYQGQPIVVNGVAMTSYGGLGGQTQTYFSATPEQQADPHINAPFAQIPGPIVAGMAQRDQDRLINFGVQNGSAQPVYPVEEVLLGGPVANRALAAVGRLAGSLDVVFAGKVTPSSSGNISAQQVTMEGMSPTLTASDLSVLSKIDGLANTTLQGDAREFVADNYFMRNGYTPLNGKCGSNCFDGVYMKDGKVYINEVKPLNADGTIKLSPENKATNLPAQMSDAWIDTAVNRLVGSGDPSALKAANAILAAKENGTLVKVISGINKNGMTLVKIK